MASLALGVAGTILGGPYGWITGAIGATIGSFIDNAIFNPHHGPPPLERLNNLNVTSATYGQAVPLVYGVSRIPGQLIYSSALREVDVTSGAKSGAGKGGIGARQGSVQATYYADFAIGICEGPITDVLSIWMNGRLVWTKLATRLNEFNLSNTIGAVLTGTQTLYLGDETQMPDPVMSASSAGQNLGLNNPFGANTPALADISYASNQVGNPNTPAYRGLAYMMFSTQLLTDFGNTIPQVSFEVVGRANGTLVVNPSTAGQITSLDFIVQDICTRAGITGTDFLATPNVLGDTDYLKTVSTIASTSPLSSVNVPGYVISSQTSGKAAIQPLMYAYFFYGVDSDFMLKFNFQQGSPLAAISEDDLGARSENITGDVKKVSETRTLDTDIPRFLVVRYLLPDIDYQTGTQMAQRPATCVTSKLYSTFDLPITMEPADAKAVAEKGLYLAWSGRVAYDFSLPRSALLYDPGDTVQITYNNGATTVPVYLTSLDFGANEITNAQGRAVDAPLFTAVQPSSVPLGVPQTMLAPLDAVSPIIFEPPDQLTANGELEVWILTANTDPSWSGADVFISFDDNSYSPVGTIKGSANMGLLSASLPLVATSATGQTLDNGDLLQVNLSESDGSLSSVTQQNALQLVSLCYVDGELISYQQALNPFPHVFNLTSLVRGAYATPISAHSVGSNFALLDGSGLLKVPYSQDRIGQTLFIKLLSYNKTGTFRQDITTVVAHQYILQGTALNLPLPVVQNVTSSYTNGTEQIGWTEVQDTRPLLYELRQGNDPASGLVLGRQAHPPFVVPGNGTYLVAAVSQPTPGLTVYSASWASITISNSSLVRNTLKTFEEDPSWTGTTSFGVYPSGPVLTLGIESPDFLDNTDFLSYPNFLNTAAAYGTFLDPADFLNEVNFLGLANAPFSFLDGPNFLQDSDILDVLDMNGITGLYQMPVGHQTDAGRIMPCLVTMTYGGVGQSINANNNFIQLSNVLSDNDILGASATSNINIQPQIGLSADGLTWSWQNYIPGVYNSRFFWGRVMLSSSDAKTGANLSLFNMTVDAPPRIDNYIGVATLAAGSTITFTPDSSLTAAPFNGGPNGATLPQIQVTIMNEAAGDQIVFSGQTLSAVTIQVKNAAVGVVRTLNVQVTGF